MRGASFSLLVFHIIATVKLNWRMAMSVLLVVCLLICVRLLSLFVSIFVSSSTGGGRHVDYDQFYTSQCVPYAEMFHRLLRASGTVLIRCTYQQLHFWDAALRGVGFFVEPQPILEQKHHSRQTFNPNSSFLTNSVFPWVVAHKKSKYYQGVRWPPA